MSKGHTYELFDQHGNLRLEAMQAYLRGDLNAAQRAEMEAFLADNPFEAEALEGLREMQDSEEATAIVEDINTNIAAGHAGRQRRRGGGYFRLSFPSIKRYSGVAAIFLVMIASTWMLLKIGTGGHKDLAENSDRPSELMEKAQEAPAYPAEEINGNVNRRGRVDMVPPAAVMSAADSTVTYNMGDDCMDIADSGAFGYGGADGVAAFSQNGGTPPYTYSLSPPAGVNTTTNGISALPPGTYSVTVTDTNGNAFNLDTTPGEGWIAMSVTANASADEPDQPEFKAEPGTVASGDLTVDDVAQGGKITTSQEMDTMDWVVNDYYKSGGNVGIGHGYVSPPTKLYDSDMDNMAVADQEDEILEDAEVEEEAPMVLLESERSQLSEKGLKSKMESESQGFHGVVNTRQAQLEEELDKAEEVDMIFTAPEVMPQYPGGEQALEEYLAQLELPATQKNVKGVVKVELVIDEKGDASQIKILEGLNKQVDEAVVSHLEDMLWWIPGTVGGERVKVRLELPVKVGM